MEKVDANNSLERYNITNDPGERIDLANTNVQKRKQLLRDLLKWIAECKAPLSIRITATNKPIQGTLSCARHIIPFIGDNMASTSF